MNAVERYFAAARAHDIAAAVRELSPDVVMRNPATDDPVVGPDAVAANLRRVQTACDTFAHTGLLQPASGSDPALYALLYEATVGDARLHGVDLLRLNDADQICEFTVLARPLASLMALGGRMAEQAEG